MCFRNRALIMLSLMAALPSAADIYRCQTEDGKWLFTDGQCDHEAGELVKLSPLVIFRKLQPVILSQAEHRALADMNERTTEARDARIKKHRRISSRIRKNNKIKQQNCTRAQRDRAGIRDKRSHGYKVSEAREMDQKIRYLEKIIKANCA